MQGRFAGKSVLVAGGTGGLGQAITDAFLAESASVAVTYQRIEEFEKLKSGLQSASLEGHQVDVTDQAAVEKLVGKIISKHERIDVLVNSVGAYAGAAPLWQVDLKVFEQMLSLNLRAGFVLMHAVIPGMLKQKSGAIVNVASRSAFDHAAGAVAYAASKAAAVAMIDCLAADLKGTGVRANSVSPSIIDTEANRRAIKGADYTKWPKPEDIASVILFLCSDESKLINGAAIPVYGEV